MSGPHTRQRTIVLRDDPVFYIPPGYSSGWHSRLRLTGRQITTSEGHPWKFDSKFPGSDVGGPFRTERTYYNDDRGDPKKGLSASPMYSLRPWNGVGGTYHGPIYPELPTSLPFPNSVESSDDELFAWGAKAIALCKPTSPSVSLSVTMGELMREGLPSLVGLASAKNSFRDVRDVGGEYLNVVFGWQPLIADLKASVETARTQKKIIDQYIKDAGKLVRRGYDFDTVETSTDLGTHWGRLPNFGGVSTNTQDNHIGWFSDWPNHGRPMYVTRQTKHRRWFRGAFMYYLPDGFDSKSKMDMLALKADKLYGISLTPETVWNLTPWSWALDWVGNIGDVLANYSDFVQDGLVMPYGYLMEHSIVTDTYTMPDVALRGYGKQTFTLSLSREVKKRVRASPYGFGFTFDSFSTKQKSILAALGLTRAR